MLLQLLNGLSFAGLLFVLSSGFTLVFGLMRIVNLAYGAFFLLGGYIGLTVQVRTGSFIAAVLVAGLAVAVLGAVCERLLLRPVRGDPLPEVLLTVGLSLVIADGTLAIWGGDPQSIPPPAALSGSVQLLGETYPTYRLFVLLVAVALGLLLYVVQDRTRVGALVRAGVDDREMIQALGVDINWVFTGVFVFGSFLAGVSGVIGAAFLGLTIGSDLALLLLALVVVIVGGLGSLRGAAIGSVIIGLLDTFGRTYTPQFSYFTLFAPMLLVLVLRPQGLFGRKLA